jgi:hypothetical protein
MKVIMGKNYYFEDYRGFLFIKLSVKIENKASHKAISSLCILRTFSQGN